MNARSELKLCANPPSGEGASNKLFRLPSASPASALPALSPTRGSGFGMAVDWFVCVDDEQAATSATAAMAKPALENGIDIYGMAVSETGIYFFGGVCQMTSVIIHL